MPMSQYRALLALTPAGAGGRIEQIKAKALRPSGIMQFEKDGLFIVKTIWVDDMDRAQFHPESREEIARRAAKQGVQLVAGAPYKRLRLSSSSDYSVMSAFDVRAKHPRAAEYLMARIESALINDEPVAGLDNCAQAARTFLRSGSARCSDDLRNNRAGQVQPHVPLDIHALLLVGE